MEQQHERARIPNFDGSAHKLKYIPIVVNHLIIEAASKSNITNRSINFCQMSKF